MGFSWSSAATTGGGVDAVAVSMSSVNLARRLSTWSLLGNRYDSAVRFCPGTGQGSRASIVGKQKKRDTKKRYLFHNGGVYAS